jgi:hypothetical protein
MKNGKMYWGELGLRGWNNFYRITKPGGSKGIQQLKLVLGRNSGGYRA